MITLGIDGGPRAGSSVQVQTDTTGAPPERLVLDGVHYQLEHIGIEPHDPRWHYCAAH